VNCTFANNTATGTTSAGGAIQIGGSSNVSFQAVNCTFANNTAAGTAGVGGAIQVTNTFSQTFLISNCTITGNKASGATGKGGGIARSSTSGVQTFQVDSSIISGNSAATGPDAFTTQTVKANYS